MAAGIERSASVRTRKNMDGATAPSRQAAETITSAAMRWCCFDPNQEPKHGLNLTIPRAATVYLERMATLFADHTGCSRKISKWPPSDQTQANDLASKSKTIPLSVGTKLWRKIRSPGATEDPDGFWPKFFSTKNRTKQRNSWRYCWPNAPPV